MRKILFRGKEKSTGKWVEGSYVYAHKFYGTGEAGHKIYNIYGDDKVLIDSVTIGQFTGLTDKNGKKIFEGDVVRITEDGCMNGFVGIVEYNISAFELKNIEDHDVFEGLNFYEEEQFEVIGNIHDNPELLEGV